MISYTSESSVFDGGLSPAKIVPLIGSSTGFSALALLVSSLFKQYPSIAELENDVKMFDKAMKHTDSKNELKYISLLKAKKLAQNGNKDQSLILLDSIYTNNPAYNELYEEIYGLVLSIN